MAQKIADIQPGLIDRLAPLKWGSRLLRGQVISVDFFARHWLAILVTITVMLIYITNKYNCQTSMEEIQYLSGQLDVARTEAIRERSAYMTKITERAMQQRLDSLGLPLRVQDHPPMTLHMR